MGYYEQSSVLQTCGLFGPRFAASFFVVSDHLKTICHLPSGNRNLTAKGGLQSYIGIRPSQVKSFCQAYVVPAESIVSYAFETDICPIILKKNLHRFIIE
ncbi:MAG: hypothetical protein LBQ79_13090 [Deltaproteobacteria bacterium]|nr:hypothetical protein [Deltaproteobacteria bacterium]